MTNLTDVINSVYHIKLVSGEEIITVVHPSDNDDIIAVSNPMQMHVQLNMSPADGGHQTFFFTAWQPMTDETIFEFDILNIITMAKCSERVAVKYLQLVSNDDDNMEEVVDAKLVRPPSNFH